MSNQRYSDEGYQANKKKYKLDQIYHEVSATWSRTLFDLLFWLEDHFGSQKDFGWGGVPAALGNMGMFLKRYQVIDHCPSYDQFSSSFCLKANTNIENIAKENEEK